MSSLIHKKICRLVCVLCKRYLSRTPLCVIQNGKTICGRCVAPEGAIRELLLEKLLENKQFPCIFDKNGCLMTNKFDQTVEHERWCKYRVMLCPLALSIQCTTHVIATDILDHIWEAHKGYIYGSHVKFMFNTTATKEHKFFLICESELFEISLSLSRETGNVWHKLISTNFPFEPKKFGYTFEEGLPASQMCKSDNDENLPNETGRQVILAIVTMFSKMKNQDFHCRIECINCTRLTKPFYWHDTRQGWLCYACSSSKNICSYNLLGCMHRDRDGNLEKHTLYFCPYAIRCPICNESLTNQYIVNHYTREHLNITFLDRTQFTLNPRSKTDGWFLIDSKIGKVLCRYQITDNSLALRLHTRLRSDELNHYKCHIIIGNPNLDVGQLPISEPLEAYYTSVFDWGFELTGDYFKAIFKNGLCTIKTEFMKRISVSSGEWFNDLFQGVNEPDQVILVE